MSQLNKELQIIIHGKAPDANIIKGEGYRLTLLSDRLLRVEVDSANRFVDDPTLCFWNRESEKVDFEIIKKDNLLVVVTAKVSFLFDTVDLKVKTVIIDGIETPCDNRYNLLGTRRTLDQKPGKVKLGIGIMGKNGVAVIDDSKSLLLVDSMPTPRSFAESDKYIFAYGRAYREALVDFYKVTGQVPILPKFVLGNWWSRYRAYTQEEYIGLMQKFEEKKIPITVATVDMDWHWVKVNEKFGTEYKGAYGGVQSEGWTGYSWNTDLFPDYKEFLRWLHEHKYHTTLNLHPAQGVRPYEDMYPTMAKNMGVDPESKQTIKFDLASEKFINNYFNVLHHPYEKDGVDFWWMDWQQGYNSTIKGLDPLWALNHFHYLDNASKGRGVLLSRYCGIGAHRYPIGFSGDTMARWSALRFQPYFTNTATNIGYSWWSHDIGGHHMGFHDDEMYLRWCQYGVFSPINRLHSTNHDLMGKEPWNYTYEVNCVVSDFLRLRHKLLPYIYTMNYRTHTSGIAICEPMYYTYPYEEEAYRAPNQYWFGSEMIVSPVVTRRDKIVKLAKTKVWLPKGRFTDIFTKVVYEGGQTIDMYRDIDSIPVLAKEGAIIVTSDEEGNSIANPVHMTVSVYRGNGSFSLYEDDGITKNYNNGKYATTTFNVQEREGRMYFEILPVEGDRFATEGLRYYTVEFVDIVKANCKAVIDENELECEFSQKMTFRVPCDSHLKILLTQTEVLKNGDFISESKRILSRVNMGNIKKLLKYKGLGKLTDEEEFYNKVMKSSFPRTAKGAIKELYSATRKVQK